MEDDLRLSRNDKSRSQSISRSYPQYDTDNSSQDSDDVGSLTNIFSISQKNVEEQEYITSSDDEEPVKVCQFDMDTIVGLAPETDLYISGIFKLQVIRGGVIFHNVHFNACDDLHTVWNPLCTAIPSIRSSHYAGWTDEIFASNSIRQVIENTLSQYPCIIRIQNATHVESLFRISQLLPDVNYLWKPRREVYDESEADGTFSILSDSDEFNKFEMPGDWQMQLEKLSLQHNSDQFDMRVMVIGGKNTGKSTFLRVLAENLIHNELAHVKGSNESELLYLDLDPGQPEHSPPDSISLVSLATDKSSPNNKSVTRNLGNHLCQGFDKRYKTHYIGSSSPEDDPVRYLNAVDDIIDELDGMEFYGSSLVNLPGWIKGYGLTIMNHVISKYKPTNLIIMENASSSVYLNELKIPNVFSNSLNPSYKPKVLKLSASTFSRGNHFSNMKFNASQLRLFRALAYFHSTLKTQTRLLYDFEPTVMRSPLQISFGAHGIRGIYFPKIFHGLHDNDLKGALECTVVGLYKTSQELNDDMYQNKAFPMLRTFPQRSTFVSIGLIHSIDTKRKIMNIYIPVFEESKVNNDSKTQWILLRGKAETPLCELYTPDLVSVSGSPYITDDRRKKHEQVWKVRKNVMRRGQTLK